MKSTQYKSCFQDIKVKLMKNKRQSILLISEMRDRNCGAHGPLKDNKGSLHLR